MLYLCSVIKKQKYMKIGDKVKTTKVSPYRTAGIIEEVYKEGEYTYYVIKGRVYREKDLKKVGR